jgi:hypothetical protein
MTTPLPSATACCVEQGTPRSPRRLHGAEAVVIIVIVSVAAALVAAGVPSIEVLQLLGGAGLVAGTTLALARGSLRAARPALAAALAAR